MDTKICVVCIIEKSIDNFTTNTENVNSVIYDEVWNVTMRTKINYQINENYIMKRTETCYSQSLN